MIQEMFYEATPLIFKRAQELRYHSTPAEIKLWEYLRSKPSGYKFRRQHPISPFVTDFYCHALKLVIEVDGSIHNKEEVKQADKSKQWSLETEGIQVIRFTNHEIENQFEIIITSINTILIKVFPKQLPLQGAGGQKKQKPCLQ
jgi:cyclase